MYNITDGTKLQALVNASVSDQVCAIVTTMRGHDHFENHVIVRDGTSQGVRLVSPVSEVENPVEQFSLSTPTGLTDLKAILPNPLNSMPTVIEPILRGMGLLPSAA